MRTSRFAQVAVALVLVVGAGIAWVFGGDGGDPSRPRTDQVQGDPRRPATPKPNPPLVQPGGTVLLDTADTFRNVEKAQVLAPRDLEVLEPHVSKVTLLVTDNTGVTTGTWLFELKSGQEPAAALDAVTGLYTDSGFETLSVNPIVQAVTPPTGTTTYRAHYLSRHGLIRVEAYGPDPEATRVAFTDLLKSQLDNTPQLS
jgi:hypothetical protein